MELCFFEIFRLQSRPSQYNGEFLSHRYLVSFHKHFMVDPMKDVYYKYLHEDKNEGEQEEKKDEL